MTKNPPTKAKPVADAVRTAIAGAVQTVMLRPEEIAPSPTNPRKTFPEASLIELGQSMVLDGQVQAIIVRPITVDTILQWNKDHAGFEGERPTHELVVGERRWRAATLGKFELRAEVRPLTDLEVVRIQIIENLHREEVHPLEEAEGYEFLLHKSGEQITIDQIADEVGKSRSYIHKRMKLAALCPDARKAFYAGDYDASTALLIARLPTPGLQLLAIEEIRQLTGYNDGERPSYRAIRDRLAGRFHLELARAPFDITDATLLPACGSCAACPKRTGNQPMLFDDDAGPDVCTDPDCFAEKKSTSVANALAAARKQGLKVIEGEDAKALKPHSWREPVGYKDLDATAYEDAEGNDVTWGQLAEQAGKKAPKPIVFVDPHHPGDMPDKLITDEEATQLLSKFAPPDQRPATGPAARREAETPEAKKLRLERESAQREDAIRRQRHSLLAAALSGKADKPRTLQDLVVIVFALSGEEISDQLLEAAGVTLPGDDDDTEFDHEAALFTALQTLAPDKLGGIALRLALGELSDYSYYSVPTAALEAAARAHKIDVDGIRAKAEANVGGGDEDGEEE